MRRRCRILSALLRYPDAELVAALPEITTAIGAAGFRPAQAGELRALCAMLAAGELLDRQADYVRLFDRSRATSLDLFEHVHGDSRQRGAAMVALTEAYHAAGYAPAGRELPDHLPLLLEFLSVAPTATARDILAQLAPILEKLHAALLARGGAPARGYAAVVAATLAEAGMAPRAGGEPAAAEAPEDLAALDRAWEDAPVVFGPAADPSRECGGGAIRTMVERLRAGHAGTRT
jgi:nitrate reductase delta subunit